MLKMIDFSKIQEDDLLEEDEEETLDLPRILLPVFLAEEDPSWRKESLCLVYPSINFFDGFQRKKAKAVCFECGVRERCLEYAMDNNEEGGVWGGLDENERKQLKGQGPRKRNYVRKT